MEPNVIDKINEVDLKQTMESKYLDYSMSVIIARALPDVRDGLKPVQRRILFALNQLGITSDKTTTKCATIVGETMGKYHPHGDSSIYGALVNMGQPWNYRKVLITKQGNFGSEDGDGPAAMRYTEAKMSQMAELMLDGINKNEVDFIRGELDFDEPTVLPARFPNLLVNGTQGIAVGMASSIPTHNLKEVVEAVIKIINDDIDDKKTSIDDLLKIIKGPDFPTGAQILGKKGIKDYLTTGKGRVLIRSVCEIETTEKGRQRIIVKELPYQVYRSDLIKKMADLVKDKKIDGITNIIDVYGKTSSNKIMIELKKDANANIVLNQLYKKTELQTTFSVQMLCIVDGVPRTMNVLDILNEFLKHQIEVVTRRTKFDLNKCEERAHILEGLLKALSIIDDIIKTIRESKDAEEAKEKLIKNFDFTDKQAQSIVDMRLRALTNLEWNKLKEEYDELVKQIAYYKELLNDNKKMLSLIKDELSAIVEKEKDERSTKIIEEEHNDFEVEELVEESNIVITMTHLGYIKRMDVDNFKTQGRGGRGIKGMQTINDDFIKEVFMTTMHSILMFITNKGRMFTIRGREVPEASRTARGTAIVNILKLNSDEVVTAGVDCKLFDENQYIVMATKKGIIKKVRLSEFNNVRTSGIKAINLKDDDQLISAKITNGNDDIFLITKKGLCVRFNEDKVRDMSRIASGIRGIKLKEDDELISMLVSNEGKELLLISENGIGKRTDTEEFAVKGRGGKGMICYKPNDKTGDLVGAELVNGNEDIMIINEKGTIIRLEINDIRVMGRSANGVRMMTMEDDTIVASITKVIEEDDSKNIQDKNTKQNNVEKNIAEDKIQKDNKNDKVHNDNNKIENNQIENNSEESELQKKINELKQGLKNGEIEEGTQL